MNDDFKLGAILIQNYPFPQIAEVAQRIEEVGWDTIWVADEFNISLECWTTLAGLANVTSTIRLGSLISAIMLRHPAILAKTASTVDNLSNGRLEVGVGSGVPSDMDPVYRMTGIDEWQPGERVKRFKEQVEILNLLLRLEKVTYKGQYYNLDECELTPRPMQKPRPPITIGAHGPRMLRITAEFADRWNTHGEWRMTLDETIETLESRIQLFDDMCDDFGRKASDVVRSALTYGQWESEAFTSIEKFEEITNRFRDIGFQEVIHYYPFWDDSKQGIFAAIDSDVLSGLR
ncbi:MAG: LLM class flavin-dependent oxidoreductase [Promethearchaeota archaeon]